VNQVLDFLRAMAPLAAGLALAFAAYVAARSIELEVSGVRGAPARRMTRLAGGAPEPSLSERIGDWMLRRLGLSSSGWSLRLEWARLGGDFEDWTTGGMVGQGLLYSLMGAALAVVFGGGLFWASVPLLFFWPFLRVRSRANRVQAVTRRALPETATLVAAEMAAGNAPDQALTRVVELPGPLGSLLGRAMSESRATGRPIFSKSAEVRGTLVETLAEMGMPELLAFASQLDLVASKGAAGPELMAGIASGLAREHRLRVMRAAEELESNLVIPGTLFFFLPFVAAVMIPLLLPLLSLF
jgi:tight adherence protein C